jgi:predicted RNA-binding protein YlxR (DUF448 family)
MDQDELKKRILDRGIFVSIDLEKTWAWFKKTRLYRKLRRKTEEGKTDGQDNAKPN